MREDRIDCLYKDAVFNIPTSKQKLKQKEYLPVGNFPVIDQGKDTIGGFTNDKNRILDCELPIIVFGDHTKNVKLINFLFAPGADGTKVLQPKKHIIPTYLYFLTDVLVFKIKDKGYARHYQYIQKETFPLVSEPEQKAIVKKIEQLFSSLDSGIADLKKAQEQLVIYRQAVLKNAFEGELTKEWRNENKIKFDWKTVKLEEICEHITDGDHQAPPKADSGIPFITISNINKSNKEIDFTKTYFVGLEYYSKLSIQKTPIKGDVLYTVTGSFGIPVLVNFDKEFCFQRHIGLLRPNNDLINQKWLFYILQSQSVYKQAYEKATGTAQKTVSLRILRNITVLLCSIQEQHQIVREIESRLSVCDKVEESIQESLLKAQALRQSILKKAFEGTLLSEEEIAKCKADTDYEPASVLLEKIKAEKTLKK